MKFKKMKWSSLHSMTTVTSYGRMGEFAGIVKTIRRGKDNIYTYQRAFGTTESEPIEAGSAEEARRLCEESWHDIILTAFEKDDLGTIEATSLQDKEFERIQNMFEVEMCIECGVVFERGKEVYHKGLGPLCPECGPSCETEREGDK